MPPPRAGRQRVRLPPPDAAWLGLDAPRNPMAITAVLRFDAPLEWQPFRRALEARLIDRYPAFRCRLARTRLGWPVWVPDPAFELDRHLERLVLPAPGDDAALRDLLGSLLPQPVDLSSSPWHFLLVDGYQGGGALVVRLHHCLADGIALAGVLLSLTDGPDGPDGAALPPRTRKPSAARVAAAVLRTGAQVLASPRSPAAFRGRPGLPRGVAWMGPLAVPDLKAVAGAVGATVNDVLLALLAGALREELTLRGERPVDVRVLVPVSLRRSPAGGALGNRFGVVRLRLPVAERDPVERVRAVAARTGRLTRSAEPVATYVLLGLVAVLPPTLQRLAARLLGATSTAVVTSVPGPSQPVSVAGSRLADVTFWAPQPGTTGLSVSLFRYAGSVTLGIAADRGVLPDPGRLTDAVAAGLPLLARAVRGR